MATLLLTHHQPVDELHKVICYYLLSVAATVFLADRHPSCYPSPGNLQPNDLYRVGNARPARNRNTHDSKQTTNRVSGRSSE